MILLVSLPLSFKNLVNSLNAGKFYITLEKVKFALYTRKFRFKSPECVNDASSSLSVFSIKIRRSRR